MIDFIVLVATILGLHFGIKRANKKIRSVSSLQGWNGRRKIDRPIIWASDLKNL